MWPVLPRTIGQRRVADVVGDRRRRLRDAERPGTAAARTLDGDVVEHDRRDDLVGARKRLQRAGDEAPDAPRRACRR